MGRARDFWGWGVICARDPCCIIAINLIAITFIIIIIVIIVNLFVLRITLIMTEEVG